MKITSHHLNLIVVGLLLFATGFTISKTRKPAAESKTSTHSSENFQSRTSPRAPTTELRHRLTALENQAGPERLLRLIAIIERSNLDTLPDLARNFVHDRSILNIIALHWFNLDPNHCLQNILENRNEKSFPSETLMYLLSKTWLARDFTGLVQTIDELPLQDRKWWGFLDLFCGIADIDYHTGLRLMREAELTNTSPSSKQVVQLAAENPRKTADDLRQVTNGFALLHSLEQVATEWAKSEPEEALSYALAIPGERGEHMSSAALKTWASHSPEAAATWLASQPNTRIQDQLRPALLNSWRKKDPEAARDYCITHLTGFRQRQALRLLEKELKPN